MTPLLLAGNSIANRDWIERVAHTVKPDWDAVRIHYYRHWETGDATIDLDYELDALRETVADITDYAVFAKSAGMVLSVRAIYDKVILPQRCVFAGSAIGWAHAAGYPIDEWITNYHIPTLFIQNEHDPAIAAVDLKQYLTEHGVCDFTLQSISGDTHAYDDLEYLRKEMAAFAQAKN